MIGTSIKFIDENLNTITVATGLIKTDTHKSSAIADALDALYLDRYGFRLSERVLYSGSDTANAARCISKHLQAIQGDCEMHQASLCVGYGFGILENVKTVIEQKKDGIEEKKKLITTPGGEFPDGAKIINKFQNLVNFINNSGTRKEELSKIWKQYDLPPISLKNPARTRVASNLTLLQSVLANKRALELFFEHVNLKQIECKVFNEITDEMWKVS